MAYQVKEIFYTLQGEGARSGRAAVFCRFAGCNLWSGRAEDRSKADCYFCDTDFVGVDGPGGGKFENASELSRAIGDCWPHHLKLDGLKPYVVFTGGEPTLQLDAALVEACQALGFETAIETNGTRVVDCGVDWITVSPKPNAELKQRSGNELKLVYPHEVTPESLVGLQFELFYISPLQTADQEQNAQHLRQAVVFCQANPQWRLTGQYHKLWGIP